MTLRSQFGAASAAKLVAPDAGEGKILYHIGDKCYKTAWNSAKSEAAYKKFVNATTGVVDEESFVSFYADQSAYKKKFDNSFHNLLKMIKRMYMWSLKEQQAEIEALVQEVTALKADKSVLQQQAGVLSEDLKRAMSLAIGLAISLFDEEESGDLTKAEFGLVYKTAVEKVRCIQEQAKSSAEQVWKNCSAAGTIMGATGQGTGRMDIWFEKKARGSKAGAVVLFFVDVIQAACTSNGSVDAHAFEESVEEFCHALRRQHKAVLSRVPP